MLDFMKAMNIFLTYMEAPENCYAPFHCEHDVMYFYGIDPAIVSETDIARLDALGFYTNEDSNGFYSYRYGSC